MAQITEVRIALREQASALQVPGLSMKAWSVHSELESDSRRVTMSSLSHFQPKSASLHLHVFCDEPNAILSDGDAIELDHIAVSRCKLKNADLCQECLLRFLVALKQHFDGNLLHKSSCCLSSIATSAF